MKSFGEWLKNKREGMELSRKELADLMGLSGPAKIHYMENGEHEPTRKTLEALIKAMGLPEEEVLLAAGIVPEGLRKGIRRNMAETLKFMKRMQKV